MQILHVAMTGWFQIDQDGGFAAKPVEAVEIDLDPRAASYGCEMNDRVGRAARRKNDPERVGD